MGFNQICDVAIDKVNKPYLPLASGEMSSYQAWLIVLASCSAALALGVASGSAPLLATLAGSGALGLIYSADWPGMRWKRFPMLAAACILVVRALAVQFGFFLHIRVAVLGREACLGAPVLVAAAFMSLFSLVIAFFKDIPDVRGDRASAIRTLSVRFGEAAVFRVCVALLLVAYAGAAAAALLASGLPWPAARFALAAAHAALAGALWRRSLRVDTASHAALTAFYMYIWKLFYAEYALIPFFR